jgi:hypothetical protein
LDKTCTHIQNTNTNKREEAKDETNFAHVSDKKWTNKYKNKQKKIRENKNKQKRRTAAKDETNFAPESDKKWMHKIFDRSNSVRISR